MIIASAFAAHRWVAASHDNLEHAIGLATRYVLTPASLIEEHGVPPQSLDTLVRLIEVIVVDSAKLGPERPVHRYWQGRVLMAMPAVYKRLGRTAERLERGERAIAIFRDLAASHPGNVDYRRRMAVSHDFHAHALAELGRHGDAVVHWQAQIEIAGELLARQPGHWRWLWYQSGAAASIGASLIASGLADRAKPHLEASLSQASRLCVEHVGEQRDCMCRIAGRAGRLLASLPGDSG